MSQCFLNNFISQFSSVQSLRCVLVSGTPWTAAAQASLSITSSCSLPKLMSMESVMPSARTMIIQHSQILGKQIHKWIKLVPVWKDDHKCLAWDRFPSPILDESRLLQSCRLVGASAFRRFHFQSSLELPGLWVLVSTASNTSTGFPHFKTQKGDLGVCFLKNSPEILIQNSYLSLLLLSKFFMGKKEKDFNSLSLDTTCHEHW